MKIDIAGDERLEVWFGGKVVFQHPPPKPAPAPTPPPPRGPGEYQTGPRWRGLNRGGAEYGAEWNGWTGQTFYKWPTPEALDAELPYLAGRGFNLVRLPIVWERLQHRLGGPFCQAYVDELLRVVKRITGAGFACIVDLHNYNRYATGTHVDDQGQAQRADYVQRVLGDGVLKNEHLIDAWKKLAGLLKGSTLVHLELMNEPHDFPVTSDDYVEMVNAQIAAIRTVGATNIIHVPNSRGSDATHFFPDRKPPNGGSHDTVALLKVRDPAGRIVFHIHQYLKKEPTSPTELRDIMVPVTEWAAKNGLQLFLGEFGSDPAWPLTDENFTNLLTYLHAHSPWVGWAPWNLDPYRVTAKGYVADGPLMAPLRPFLTPR